MPFDRPLRIAFVACNRNVRRFTDDASFIYRCQNLASALCERGHVATLTHVTRLNPAAALDVAVFHRPRYTFAFRAMAALLRRRGVQLVADVDDLIFDDDLARFSPGVVNDLVPLADTKALYRSHRRALRMFRTITVSTVPLREEAERCFPGARVLQLPNAVHHRWRCVPEDGGRPPGPPRITYFPGTRSHDRDFATITAPLNRVLAQHPEVELHITGPLEHRLDARAGQVHHHPKVPFEDLHPKVRAGTVNLAPLESTPFTRCKSALKVLEAGYWGIPTLCSPLPDAERFRNAGAIMVDSPERWCAELERLLGDRGYYDCVTHDLRARVLERADVDRVADEFLRLAACESGGRHA